MPSDKKSVCVFVLNNAIVVTLLLIRLLGINEEFL
jgi:hypothetical protein